ncbi:MAG: DUF4270 family protein [Paramuribaculum sp.]|nr:DUF4270 family protein [Paramuribaculum sp.]
MRNYFSLITIFLSGLIFYACQDETSTIGSSLVTDETVILVDSSFTLTGRTLTDPVVQSRTITQLLGRLQADEYGNITSDVVMQFMPSMGIDTVGVTTEDIDSIKLLMFMTPGDFTGDSLVPMGLEIYKLNKQLPSPIYSDFSPEGYYDPNPIASQIYTGNALYNDSINNLSYRTISVDLPLQLGKDIFSHYVESPEDFADPNAFTKWFPGLYVTNSFGSGLIVNISETRINLHYRKHATYENSLGEERDTVYKLVRSYLAVVPEVITNNNIKFEMSDFLSKKIDAGEALIVTPTGTEVELTFPALDIISTYKQNAPELSLLNTLEFSIPAEEIENSFGIKPPDYLLMVLSKNKKEFFAENKIADNKTSFMGTYSPTDSLYSFGNLRQYIIDLMDQDEIDLSDYTFTITPVNLETETSSDNYYGTSTTYIVNVSPYVTKPAMVKLNIDAAKIKLTYTRQYTKNY